MNIKEFSLKKALEAKRLSEIPKQFREDGDKYWLEAIILTRKRDGSQSYAAGKRGADGKITYTSDFGTISQIVGLVSVHPYLYLDKKKYMPYDSIEQKRIALIKYIGGDDEAKKAVGELSDSEVEYQILNIAIDLQYSSANIDKTHEDILNAVKGNTAVKDEESKKGEDKGNIQKVSDAKSKAGRPRKTKTEQ